MAPEAPELTLIDLKELLPSDPVVPSQKVVGGVGARRVRLLRFGRLDV